MNIPEWQKKLLHEMNDEEKALHDAWEPTEEEAIAVSHAVFQEMCDQHGMSLEIYSHNGLEAVWKPSDQVEKRKKA